MCSELRRFFERLLLGLLLAAQGLRAAPSKPIMGCESTKCPWSLWSHYVEKGCEPMYDNATSCCPSRFNCPPKSANPENAGCKHRGRSFAVGSTIDHSNPCRMCTCNSGPSVQCLNIECPEMFHEPDPSCRLIYAQNVCCSIRTVCPPSKELSNPASSCKSGRSPRRYLIGEQMPPEGADDACATCRCAPGGVRECPLVDTCYLEKESQLDEGWIPVYFHNVCCPIDWISPPEGESAAPPSGGETQTQKGCTFGGRHYPLGSALATPLTCTTCTCATPPEFTCVQRRC